MSDERAQTLPDFAVGVTLFLGVVAFVALFVPQLIAPYDAQEQPVVVDRVADDLEGRLLAAEEPAAGLDEPCTLSFFTDGADDDCPFATDDDLTTRLGIDGGYSVNVTLRDAPSDAPGSAVYCAVNGSVDDCQPGADRLAAGPPVPTGDHSVATARRRVAVGDADAVLEVEVW